MKLKLKDCKDGNERFQPYADDGSPIIYYDDDGDEFCVVCANKKDRGPEIVGAAAHVEGGAIPCDDCGDGIESLYGNPEDNNEEGKKTDFFPLGIVPPAVPDKPIIRIPYYSWPIRHTEPNPDDPLAVFPWDGGEYLLVDGDYLIGQFSEKYRALALLEDCQGLCRKCWYPRWKSHPHVCGINSAPPTEEKEIVIDYAAEDSTLERLKKRGATIQGIYCLSPRRRTKIYYTVVKRFGA